MPSLNERARDFWDRISPRERRLVVIAVIAIPITIALWLGLAIHDGLTDMDTRNEKMRKALRILDDLNARGPVKPGDDVVATMGTEPLSLDTYLTNAAQKAGFVLKGTTPRNPVTKNGFVTNSVAIQLSDLTVDQMKKFLQEVETASKVVVVTRLEIQHRDYKNKEKLDANLEISTYSKEKSKEDKPASDNGSGSAGSGGSGGSDAKKGG